MTFDAMKQLADMRQPRECLEDGSDCGSTLCPYLPPDEDFQNVPADEVLAAIKAMKANGDMLIQALRRAGQL